MATVQIRSKELAGTKDFNEFLEKLNRLHDGKWVAILDNGELVTGDTVEQASKAAAEKKGKVVFLTYASKKDQLLLV